MELDYVGLKKNGKGEANDCELLFIQKFIALLSDFHYQEFLKGLNLAKARLPIKLAETVRKRLPQLDTHAELCRKIYGSASLQNKKKFNQLAAHTFRLSFYLARNYPDYLAENIRRIEHMVNTGETSRALCLTRIMLDVARSIGDFRSQIWCLVMLQADAAIHRDMAEAKRTFEGLNTVLEEERLALKLQEQAIKDMDTDYAPENETKYEERLNYYRSYFDHPTTIIRLLALYGYVEWVNRYHPNHFERPEDEQVLQTLEKGLERCRYLTFPFLTNIHGNTRFIRLHHASSHYSEKEKEKLFTEVENLFQNVQFTSKFINGGHVYLLVIRCSNLLGRWHTFVFRPDYTSLLPEEERHKIETNLSRCEEMLRLRTERKGNEIFIVGLYMLYGAFLYLTGKEENLRKAVSELEAILVFFQQVSLRASADSIFMVLLMSKFALKDYEGCKKTFIRYNKVKKNQNNYAGNLQKIYAYYYLSQWLATDRNQYKEKFLKVVLPEDGKELPNWVKELLVYYKMGQTSS